MAKLKERLHALASASISMILSGTYYSRRLRPIVRLETPATTATAETVIIDEIRRTLDDAAVLATLTEFELYQMLDGFGPARRRKLRTVMRHYSPRCRYVTESSDSQTLGEAKDGARRFVRGYLVNRKGGA